MAKQFDWINGIGQSKKTFCPTCNILTPSNTEKNMVFCKECWCLKGLVSNG